MMIQLNFNEMLPYTNQASTIEQTVECDSKSIAHIKGNRVDKE